MLCNITVINKQGKYIRCNGKLKRIDLDTFIFKQYKCSKCKYTLTK